MKKAFTFFVVLLVLGCFLWAEKATILKVKTQVGNIRALPDTSAEIVLRVEMGTLLEASQKSGSWYKVRVREKGKTTDGYVHVSVVEVMEDDSVEEDANSGSQARQESRKATRAEERVRSSADKRFRQGIIFQGGLSLASMTHSQANTQGRDEDEFKKRKAGFLGGLGFDMGGRVGLEIDFFYMQKGITYSGSIVDKGVTYSGEGKLNLDEVCVPVLLKIRFMPGSTPFIVAGGEVAYVLSSKVDWSFTNPQTQQLEAGTEDIIENTNRLDYGLVFGAGYELHLGGMALLIQGRYHLGLANVLKEGPSAQVEADSWVKTNAIVLMLGFKF